VRNSVAPGGGHYLLGPKLNLLKVSALDPTSIPKKLVAELQARGFMIRETLQLERVLGPFLDLLCREDAAIRWRFSENTLIAISDSFHRQVRIPIRDFEPLQLHDREHAWLTDSDLLWLGENPEGIQVGPLVRSEEDFERYSHAQQDWSSAERLKSFGFGHTWPLSVALEIERRPEQLAKSIVTVLRSRPGICRLLETGEEKMLWTDLSLSSETTADPLASQVWSKGMLKNLSVEADSDYPEVFVGRCLTPCESDAFFEGNSGKGFSREEAYWSTVGEAVERFASWRANFTTSLESGSGYPLRSFHPFGNAWVEYLRKGAPSLSVVGGVDELSGEKALVPACLIPFPLVLSGEAATVANTAGLAAHPERAKAIRSGLLELLERNNFYPAFLNLKKGARIRLDSHFPDLRSPMKGLLRRLEKEGSAYWFVFFESEFAIPTVHAFVVVQSGAAITRGSGSALGWLGACEKALLEAIQIRRLPAKEDLTSIEEWRDPVVVRYVTQYLESFSYCDFGSLPVIPDKGDDPLFTHITGRMRALGRKLIVVDLPSPLAGWSAVRVLVPGFTTHQEPSESEGGEPLRLKKFPFPVPT
jgi:ribosomal protein S12 methylthiotransferase accessory factor YcaO